LGLNDSSIIYFDAFKDALQAYKGQSVNVQVERAGQPMNIACGCARVWLLGIYPAGDMKEFFEVEEVKYGFFESFPKGMEKAYGTFENYLRQMKLMFSPETKGYESLGRFHHHRQHLRNRMELVAVLEHYRLPQHCTGGDEHPAYPCFGWRPRHVPSL
jgi:hypothetical protein